MPEYLCCPCPSIKCVNMHLMSRAQTMHAEHDQTTIIKRHVPVLQVFDELLLLKRGGETIYAGPLGKESCDLVAYFESIPGVPTIEQGYNPATWMLDISTVSAEGRLDKSLAWYWQNSQNARYILSHWKHSQNTCSPYTIKLLQNSTLAAFG